MAKLEMKFTDGQLVFIARLFQQITRLKRDPTNLTDRQVKIVFDYLNRVI